MTGKKWLDIRASVVAVAVLLASGCGGSTTKVAPLPDGQPAPPRKGGILVLAASQEPACADWLASCGNSSWGFDMMASQTLPRAFDFVDGRFIPSPLLVGAPSVEAGPPQRVTYRIENSAVWSDGVPITSSDFRYLWEQSKAVNGNALQAVQSVDDADPHVAVVTWKDPAADWRNRFDRILPAHLLQGKDRTAELRDGYTFSGGPWVIDHWTKGQEIKLVPNPRYWATQPNLDAVVFKIIPDAAAYLQAYRTGQVDMAFVQGAQTETANLRDMPDTAFNVSTGLTYEFLMFNTSKAPLDALPVRQALAHATDRDAIVRQLSGSLKPDVTAAQAMMSPGNRQWYSEPFKAYTRDLAKVGELMRGDGWARGADGVWARSGQRAVVEISTATGNTRRELTEQILQSQWKEAGFDVTIRNAPSTVLNGDWLPKGTFQIALYGLVPSTTDPGGSCANFCSKNIPAEGNGFQGGAVSRLSSPAIDAAWTAVNSELDENRRLQLVRQGQQALADQLPALPLAPVLDVVVYNTVKVGGPIKGPPPGAFANLNEWFCRTC